MPKSAHARMNHRQDSALQKGLDIFFIHLAHFIRRARSTAAISRLFHNHPGAVPRALGKIRLPTGNAAVKGNVRHFPPPF